MHWACGLEESTTNIEIVEHLLLNGGNPNVKSEEGLTPVHISSSWGYLAILKILIIYGGDPWLVDHEGLNAWDLALQKTQWAVLKYLATYMEGESCGREPVNRSITSYRFSKLREVSSDNAFLYNSSLVSGSSNLGFVDSNQSTLNSTYSSSGTSTLNDAMCSDTSNSVIVVEEFVYTDEEKGVDLVEWHYPPVLSQNSFIDATLNEALCSSEDDEKNSMDSQLLMEELKSLGSTPGPITATTKHTYLRQLYRLRKDHASNIPSPQRQGFSKELKSVIDGYPGCDSDMKVSTQLDRLFITHFTCPDPAKRWREGLSKKMANQLFVVVYYKLSFILIVWY